MGKLTFIGLVAASGAMLLLPQMFSETTAITSFVANTVFHNNFHEVVPGRFYRSAQMSREDMAATIKHHGIKTVIDLRLQDDEPDAKGVYEEQVSAANGARYYHLPISSSRSNQQNEFLRLLDIYDDAPKPVLVHCSSGTHRTGLASAFWLLEQENAPIEIAAKQFSSRYGFFQFERNLKAFTQGLPTIDNLLWRYQDARRATGITLRSWLEQLNPEPPKAPEPPKFVASNS